MGRTSNQKRTESARMKRMEEILKNETKKMTSLRFVFSIMVEGGRYAQIERILLWNDFKPPSRTTYYRVLPTIEEEIVNQTQESYC